jgi:hypothetical protein
VLVTRRRTSDLTAMLRFGALLTAISPLLVTASAYGGTYDVFTCGAPSPHAPMSAGWSTSQDTNDQATFSSLACTDHYVSNSASSNSAHARGSRVGLRWTAAPGTSVWAYALDYRVHAPGNLAQGWIWDFNTGFVEATTSGELLINHCRWPADACESQLGHWDGTDRGLKGRRASSVYLRVECARDLPADCPVGDGGRVTVKSARFAVEDTEVPRLTSTPSGELMNSTAIASGIADLRFSAADVGGGVFEAMIEVDGVPAFKTTIDEAGGKCSPPFRHPAPCPDSAVAALSYDTGQLPDGPHSVRLVVTDATGSNAASYGPVEVITANGNPPSRDRLQSLRCATATPKVRLRIKHGTVDFGRRILITGRAKQAMPGAMMALSGNSPVGVNAIAPLDTRGRFRLRLQPSESQSVRAVLLTPGGAPQCSRDRSIRVRARSTAHAARQRLRNRDALRLSGRVLGPRLPPSGTTIAIRVRGTGSKRWYRAGTVRTDPAGRWTWRYRFRRTTRPTTYVFQARVPRQRQLPYAAGRSPSVRVTVVP